MKYRQIMALSLICTMFFLMLPCIGWAEGEKEVQESEPARKVLKHVFIITIEGISSKDLLAAYTPNISGVAAGGVKGDAVGVLPPDTKMFLASMLNGASPKVLDPGGKKLHISLPGVMDSSGRHAVIVDDGKKDLPTELKGIKRIKTTGDPGYKDVDKNLMDQAISYFNKKHPYLTLVVLPGTEYARDKHAPSSKEAIVVTNKADEQIGRLLREIRSQGIYENSLIVITGSTSGKAIQRGKLDFDRVMVPLVISGPGIKTGIKIPPVRIIDIAPTLALLTGVSLSPEADGLVLWNALQSGQGFSEGNLSQKRLKELSEANISSIKESYQLLNDKINIHIQKEKVNKEKKEIESRINKKQQEIDKLKFKLNAFKGSAVVLFVVVIAGYIVEYFLLRKKFLMF